MTIDKDRIAKSNFHNKAEMEQEMERCDAETHAEAGKAANRLNDVKKRRLFKELFKKKSLHVIIGILKQDNYLTKVVTILTGLIETGFLLWSVMKYGCFMESGSHLVMVSQIMYFAMAAYSYGMFYFCSKYGERLIHRYVLYEIILSAYYSVLILFGIFLAAIYRIEGANAYVLVLVFICTFGVIIMNPVRMIIASALSFIIFNIVFYSFGVFRWHHSLNIMEIIFYMNVIGLVRYFTVCGYLETTETLSHYSTILERLSFTDELTQINNRNALRRDWNTFSEKVYSVMMLDIDDFKDYNDTYGHLVGDMVIRETARLLVEQFGPECCYRVGGDEFLVISEEVDETFTEKIGALRRSASEIKDDKHELRVTYSIGVLRAYCIEPAYMRSLLKEADAVLYEVKEQGKNNFKYVVKKDA